MDKIIRSKLMLPWYTIEILDEGLISLNVSEDFGFASKDDIKALIKDLQKSLH